MATPVGLRAGENWYEVTGALHDLRRDILQDLAGRDFDGVEVLARLERIRVDVLRIVLREPAR